LASVFFIAAILKMLILPDSRVSCHPQSNLRRSGYSLPIVIGDLPSVKGWARDATPAQAGTLTMPARGA
jgi:hypothetical protein